MKFLFVLRAFHTNQYFWTKTLLDKGNTVDVFVVDRKISETHELVQPIQLQRSSFFNIIEKISGALGIVKRGRDQVTAFSFIDLYTTMKKIDPDVVIVRSMKLYALQSFLIAKLLGKKTLLYDQAPKYTHSPVKRRLLRLLRAIRLMPPVRITPIEGVGKYNDTNAYFVPFVMDFKYPIENKVYCKNNQIHICMVGKMSVPRKEHKLLLNAVAAIKSQQFDVHVMLVGSLPDERNENYQLIRECIKTNGLENRVSIKTNVPFEEMKNIYKEADLFVLPSSNEPAAVSILEAMNFGLPVVCSDTCGTRFYIEEGNSGYIFRSGDSRDLREKIERIIKNTETVKRMGERSHWLIQNRYNPEVFYDRLMTAMELHNDIKS